jgi:hypothetical protein
MVVQNNTGLSSIKIFCESRKANVALNSARKIWSLSMPIIIPNGAGIKMLCSVESASIPLSYYTINDTNNQCSFVFGADAPILVTVPNGNYSVTTMLIFLNKSFTKIKTTFDKPQSKFVLSLATPSSMNYRCYFQDVENSIYKLLGFAPTIAFQVGNNMSYMYFVPNPVNLVYTSGIYISLNNVENANIDTGTNNQSSNVLLRIPVTQPTNTYLQYFNAIGFKNLLSATVLSSIDLSLLDDNRNLLQLTENVDWCVVLRIDFEKTITETYETTKISKMRQP